MLPANRRNLNGWMGDGLEPGFRGVDKPPIKSGQGPWSPKKGRCLVSTVEIRKRIIVTPPSIVKLHVVLRRAA